MKNLLLIKFFLLVVLIKPNPLHSQPNFTLQSSSIISGIECWGGGWGDFNNDGNLDLFAGPHYIFQNLGDGSFIEVIDHGITGNGDGLWIDYNNDGYLDVSFKQYEGLISVYRNLGDMTFSEVPIVTSEHNDVSWADYNNDGYLDIFIGLDADGSNLFKGCSDGTFKLVPNIFGTDPADNGYWGDYNNDGHIDIFISKWYSENAFYHNNGNGTMTKITSTNITGDINSIGASWIDYNNDGFLDLFVFGLTENSLYTNNGDGTFTPVTNSPLVNIYASSRSCAWGDYDNDGDLDLFVGNGYPQFNNNNLYTNNGDGTFTEEFNCIITDLCSNAGGKSWGDFDNDGDLDLVTYVGHEEPGENHFFLNNGNANNWININCVGIMSNRSAIGSIVRIKAEIFGKETWQMTQILVPTDRYGQNSLNAEFGLGDASIIDTILVEWPSGSITKLTNINVNQFISIVETEDVVFTLHPSDQNICQGAEIELHARAFSINPPLSYQWQKDGEYIPGAINDTLILYVAEINDAGIYHCIAADNISSDTSHPANVNILLVEPIEIIGLTHVEQYQIVTYSVSEQQGHLYDFWVEGGNIISSTTNSINVHWGTSPEGYVYLLETDDNGCIGDTNSLSIEIEGIEGIDENYLSTLSIYPNPCSNTTRLHITRHAEFIPSGGEGRVTSIELYSISGKKIRELVKGLKMPVSYEIEVNVSTLPAGVYIIRLQAGKDIAYRKVVVSG